MGKPTRTGKATGGAMGPRRNTTARNRHRREIASLKLPCSVCGGPIDYNLKHPHPMSFTIEHVIALANGGRDDMSNLLAAHWKCNRDKSDRTDGGSVIFRSGSLS